MSGGMLLLMIIQYRVIATSVVFPNLDALGPRYCKVQLVHTDPAQKVRTRDHAMRLLWRHKVLHKPSTLNILVE